MIIRRKYDLEEKRILGLIDDDTYYMLKIREVAYNGGDIFEQKQLIRLQLLEKRQKQKREAEERQKKKQEQEKAIKQAIEKDLPAKIEKALDKEFQKFFSKR